MGGKIEPTKRVGYDTQAPMIKKSTPNKNNLIGKDFWKELEKNKFVPNTTYSAANPTGHIPFRPATNASPSASATN